MAHPATMIQVTPAADSGLGGTVMGEWGTYVEDENGNFTIDSRDAAPLLSRGFTYVPPAPAGSGAISPMRGAVSNAAASTKK